MSSIHSSAPQLPPISMFTTRTSIPSSPPTSGYDKPILPKPTEYYSKEQQQHHHHSTTELLSPPHHYNKPDQSTLWALFNQFQQQQQQQKETTTKETDVYRRASDPSTDTNKALSSEEVLAEKRRRNAGASARFRDRRKQRERELQDKCNELEQRSKELENALKRHEPDHPLLFIKTSSLSESSSRSMTSSPPPPPPQDHTLFDRVGQLEHLMTRFRQEKETDTQKLDELEKENKYLKSLLIPVSLPSNKRIRLNNSRDSSDNESLAHDK